MILVPGGSSLGGVLNGGVLIPEKHDGTHVPPNDDIKYELRKMSTYIEADRERQSVCVCVRERERERETKGELIMIQNSE